jgi:membrane protease YdiL (CAAX protease family)
MTRLHDAFPARHRVLGANVHAGVLVTQAALFALVHLATEPDVQKLAVFFPGLLFGWLRAWRGGIGAAILFHAMSNVLAEILVRGWL